MDLLPNWIFLQAAALSLVQGATEFLPISSSAHLVLFPIWFGWQDQGLTFDVATHLGSLLAVVVYFRTELLNMARSTFAFALDRQYNPDIALLKNIVVGTIPIVVVGFFAKSFVEQELRSVLVIGITTIVFGLLLAVADVFGKRQLNESAMSTWHALVIGCAQTLALVPGTSRSGITITCALVLGFSRKASARFSFLLAIPTIIAASILTGADAMYSVEPTRWGEIATAVCVSFVAAYLCIDVFLRVVERIGMMPFVAYRVVLGLFLLLPSFDW